jgi:hypothetical protein
MLAALVAVPLAGCGSSSSGTSGGAGASTKVSAASYVHQICTSIGSFEKSVTTGEAGVNAAAAGSNPNLVQLKNTVTQFFTSAASASSAARGQIDKAGTPAVSDGPKIRTSLLAAFQSFSTSFGQAATQSKGLNANSKKQFEADAVKLQTQLQQTSQGVSTALNGLGTSLSAAAKEDPACGAIGGSSAPAN